MSGHFVLTLSAPDFRLYLSPALLFFFKQSIGKKFLYIYVKTDYQTA